MISNTDHLMDKAPFPPYIQNTNSYFAPKSSGILGNTIEEKTRAILGWTGSVSTNPIEEPQRRYSCDGLGPDRVKRSSNIRKTSCGRLSNSYPYDAPILTCNDRKSSTSSITSTATNELSTLLLSHDLTPPPSPIKNHTNGVTVVTLPRSQPMAYNQIKPCQYQFQSPCDMRLPISPVSPSTINNQTDDDLARNLKPAVSATEIFERLRNQMPQISSEQSKFRVLLQTVANVIELETKLAQLHEETRSLSNILNEKKRQHLKQESTNLNDASSEGSPKSKWADPCPSNYGSPTFAPMPTNVVEDVPDDLQGIDVTAFRCLVTEGKYDQTQDQSKSIPINTQFNTLDRSTNPYWSPYQHTDQVSICDVSLNNELFSYTEFNQANANIPNSIIGHI